MPGHENPLPNFEKYRKEVCDLIAHRLRHPKLTLEERLAFIDRLKAMLEELPT